MKISELVEELERLKKLHGDIPVRTESLTRTWPPDLVIRRRGFDKFLVLNG